jgi:hypothetical protein
MVIFRTAGTGFYFRRGLKMTKSTTATVVKALFGINHQLSFSKYKFLKSAALFLSLSRGEEV